MEGAVRVLAGFTLAAAGLGGLLGGVAVYGGISTLVGGGDPLADAPAVPLSGEPLHLEGGRGQEIDFLIADDVAIEGLWASDDGLTLSLRNPETGFETAIGIVAPEGKDWDDTITSVGSSSDDGPEIDVSFTVPDVPGPETQTLTGSITGDLEYPEERDDGTFDDVSIDVEIPVTLEIQAGEAVASGAESSRAIAVRRIIGGVVALIVALAYAVPWARWNEPGPEERRRSWEPTLMVVAGVGAWLVAASLWLFRDFFGN